MLHEPLLRARRYVAVVLRDLESRGDKNLAFLLSMAVTEIDAVGDLLKPLHHAATEVFKLTVPPTEPTATDRVA